MKSAVCIYSRDDAMNIQECIAFHKAIGFDAVVVYDNLSNDNTMALALQMNRVLDARVVSWPSVNQHTAEAEAYRDCCTRFAAEFEWIAFVNSSELITCRADERIGALLGRHTSDSAIVLNWAVFGSNGYFEAPRGLGLECFDRRAPDDFGPNQHVKMIIKPAHLTGVGNPHYFEVNGATTTAAGDPVDWLHGGVAKTADLRNWRVHKYFTRSRAEWIRHIELGHSEVGRDDKLFDAYNRNEIRDRAAARLAAPVWSLLDAARAE